MERVMVIQIHSGFFKDSFSILGGDFKSLIVRYKRASK